MHCSADVMCAACIIVLHIQKVFARATKPPIVLIPQTILTKDLSLKGK